jgi:hypothetical protein
MASFTLDQTQSAATINETGAVHVRGLARGGQQ